MSETLWNCFGWTRLDWVIFLWYILQYWARLCGDDYRWCKINIAVSIGLNIIEALYYFIDLCSNAATDHACGSDNGGNEFANNKLSFILFEFRYFVISCSDVSCSINEINVQILVVLYFKLNWRNCLRCNSFLVYLLYYVINNINIFSRFIPFWLFWIINISIIFIVSQLKLLNVNFTNHWCNYFGIKFLLDLEILGN